MSTIIRGVEGGSTSGCKRGTTAVTNSCSLNVHAIFNSHIGCYVGMVVEKRKNMHEQNICEKAKGMEGGATPLGLGGQKGEKSKMMDKRE